MKKAISIVAIIAGILILLSTAAPLIIGMILAIPTPGSVGIIGGADGPTAIMITGVAGAGGIIFAIAIGVLLTVLGIWGAAKSKEIGLKSICHIPICSPTPCLPTHLMQQANARL